jgi:hypothetical protein
MTALAVVSALLTALCIGYYVGRRTGSSPPTWKKRTSRTALGRLAINLIVLVIARRIRHSFSAQRTLAGALGVEGLKLIEPLQLLRGGLPQGWLRR